VSRCGKQVSGTAACWVWIIRPVDWVKVSQGVGIRQPLSLESAHPSRGNRTWLHGSGFPFCGSSEDLCNLPGEEHSVLCEVAVTKACCFLRYPDVYCIASDQRDHRILNGIYRASWKMMERLVEPRASGLLLRQLSSGQ